MIIKPRVHTKQNQSMENLRLAAIAKVISDNNFTNDEGVQIAPLG
ncbi:hypothetical protein RintRC_0075 [Richelia intracellularis]|nr:hypothetical protein RintRC_0075 [Richelia intracellularis]